MKHRHTLLPCGFDEDAVLAAAIEEADATQLHTVSLHLRQCQACTRLFAQYQCLQQAFTRLQDPGDFATALQRAQEQLRQRLRPQHLLEQLQCRLLASAVGALYIAKSEQGVSLVAWQPKASQLLAGHTTHEDDGTLQALVAELEGYFAGLRTQLDWPIDNLFMTSPFQQEVLKITAAIPYGAVMSYHSLAAALGRPKAVRAVAQALRRNPLAIVIPCHRVVGQTGHLTGYAGGLEAKQALLEHEGIPLLTRRDGIFINKQRMFVGWRVSRYYCTPQCPSLADLAPGETLLLSHRAVTAQHDFLPCEVCHPEAVAV